MFHILLLWLSSNLTLVLSFFITDGGISCFFFFKFILKSLIFANRRIVVLIKWPPWFIFNFTKWNSLPKFWNEFNHKMLGLSLYTFCYLVLMLDSFYYLCIILPFIRVLSHWGFSKFLNEAGGFSHLKFWSSSPNILVYLFFY